MMKQDFDDFLSLLFAFLLAWYLACFAGRDDSNVVEVVTAKGQGRSMSIFFVSPHYSQYNTLSSRRKR